LLLPAPKIAGLLPARVSALPTTLIYTSPDFAQISDAARATLIEMAMRLLDAATAYLNGAPNEGPLFRAEERFHEMLVAKHPHPAPQRVSAFADKPGATRPKRKVPSKAEMDAEIDEFLAGSRIRIQQAEERARAKLAAWRQQRKGL
jgi:hypothetical protein